MSETVLRVENLNKTFYHKKGNDVKALDNVSFEIKRGQALGLIGESGSGKSTTGKVITHLETADSGKVYFRGKDITNLKGNDLKFLYSEIQMVFQDATGSFNPRRTIGSAIEDSICNLCREYEGVTKREYAEKLMKEVDLPPEYLDRYPHQLSGGQCQRAAIARAIAVHPSVLICDEATSALDVFVQAQIMQLLKKIQEEMNLTVLFISHDLPLVSCYCDELCIMKNGRVMEKGKTEKIIENPENKYTIHLLESILKI